MSRIKKNNKTNKKSVKNNHKNYKIEALEPRMLMDATVSQWMDEIDEVNLTTQSINALDNSNFYARSNWVNKGNVDALATIDKTEQLVAVSKADFMDYVKANSSGSFNPSNRLSLVKDALREAVCKANGGALPYEDAEGKKVNDNILTAQNIYDAFNELHGGNSFVDAATDSTISISLKGNELSVFSTHFGIASQPSPPAFVADTAGYCGIEGKYKDMGLNQHLEFKINLDGDKLSDDGLIAGRYASAVFNQDSSKPAKFGVVDLIADQDPNYDLYAGTLVKVTNATSNVEYTDGVIAEFSLGLDNSKNTSLASILPSNFSYGKMGMGIGGWDDPSILPYNKITMGKVLGKLQELSSRLLEVQKGATLGDEINFGGILASDARSLLNLSSMIDSVLKQRPASLQELVKCFANCHFGKNTGAISYSINNDELSIHFEFGIDDTNAKYTDLGEKTTNVFDVAISKETLKNSMHLDVQANDCAKVETSVDLKFDLIIPLLEPTKAVAGTGIADIIGSKANVSKVIAGKTVIGNTIFHKPWSFATHPDYSLLTESAKEADSATNYVNRLMFYKLASGELNQVEISDFRDKTTLTIDSPVYGYVVDVSAFTCLTYKSNAKAIEEDPDVGAITTVTVASALKDIFVEAQLKKAQVESFGDKYVVIYVGNYNDLTEVDSVLTDITELSSVSTNKQAIWLSNKATPNISVTSDVTFYIKDNASSQTIPVVLEENALNSIENVSALSVLIQNAIEAAGGDVDVETDHDRLVFKWDRDFTILISATDAALLKLVANAAGNYVSTDGACMDVKITGLSTPVHIVLGGLSGSISVQQIMGEIVSQCNNALAAAFLTERMSFDPSTLTLTGVNIEYIENLPGYTVASLLGLASADGAGLYHVDSTLAVDPNDARFENLTLEITSAVQSGKTVEVLTRYGAFGAVVQGDLGGAKCVATYGMGNLGSYGEWHLEQSFIQYSGGDKNLEVHTTGVTVGSGSSDLLGTLTLDCGNDFKPDSDWTLVSSTHKDVMEKYGPYVSPNNTAVYPGLSMATVYEKLQGVVVRDLLNTFYANSFLANLKLPLQGKTVLDIMGLRGKINEMAKCLGQGNCNTLQELSQYFAQNLGVSLTFSLSTEGVGVDIVWTSVQLNQVTELGGMDFGLRGFNLGGSLEAYLNSALTLYAHIDLVYNNGNYTATLDTDAQKLKISGYVWLTASNVVTDMNVCVLEGSGSEAVSRQKVFQVGDDAKNNHSHLYMLANIDAVDWDSNHEDTVHDYKQSVAIRLGGTLHTSRFGIPSGDIQIGVANGSLAKNNATGVIPCVPWDNDGNNVSNVIWCTDAALLKSVAVWNGRDDNRYLTDGITGGNVVVDLTGLTESLQDVELYDMLKQVADGLSDTVRRTQSSLNSVLLKKTMRNIPLVGDSIVSAADCLTRLYSEFVEPFRKYVYNATGLNARAVAEKLYMMLNSLFPTDNADKLQIVSKTAPEYWAGKKFDNYYKGIQYMSSDDEACWRIRLHGVCVLDENGDFDFGYSGLGLKAEGGVKITLEWTLDLGFGISTKDGAFLLLSNGHEKDDDGNDLITKAQVDGEGVNDAHAGDDLRIKVTITPLNTKVKGSLGFLSMDANLQNGNPYVLNLGLDLNDGKNENEDAGKDWDNDASAKSQINFNGLKSGISVEAGLRGAIDLELALSLGIGGYEKQAPHIDSKFVFNWGADLGGDFGALKEIAFKNIVLDSGTFVQETIGGVISKINNVLKPIRPLIDFLQSEIPVLNKLPLGKIHITVLDLIKKYGDSQNMDFGFLDDIIEINNVCKKLNIFVNQGIHIDDWIVYDGTVNTRDLLNNSGLKYLQGMVNDIDKYVDDAVIDFGVNCLGFVNPLASGSGYDLSVDTTINTPTFRASWQFPLLDSTTANKEIMKLLMGGHADLVKFDLAPLEFSFDWRKSFPIVGPLCADIGFSFGACIDLCFGYDTYGIEGWVKSGFKDAKCLVNGFYIDDLKNGKDVAEVVFRSGVVAGASVAGRAGINVGLNFNVNMDFIDPNNDGKIRLKEMAELLSFNPISMFDFSATIEAKAFAYLDLFLYRKEWTLWSSGAIELFTTASKTTNRNPALCTVQEEGVYVNVGEFASNRANGNTLDSDETVVITITDTNTVNIAYDGISQDVTISGKPLYIFAGEGKDHVTIKSMKKADDTLVEGNFNIVIDGGNGNDCIDMSEATLADNCFAVIMGGAGSDIIKGAKGINKSVIFGDSGYVAYVRDDDKKVVTGVSGAISYPEEEGAGTNLIYAGDSRNVIFGGFGLDVIVGGTKDDYILGDGGRFNYAEDDVVVDSHDLYDEGGNDVIYGMSGNDRIYGGGGNDSIDAGSGVDVVYAGQGHDVVYGGAGNDELHGGDGVDVIFGDTPKDKSMLIADAGDKAAAGVLPYNYISREIKNNESSLYEGDFEKNTSMPEVGNTESSNQTDNGAIKLYDFLSRKGTNVDHSNLDALKSLLRFWIRQEHPEYDADQLETAVANAFNINGQAGAGTNSGYNDTIYGDNGSDIIFGDDGANDKNGSDVIEGGAGNDFIDGDAGDDKISGDSGDDIIYGGLGNDYLDGGANNDIVMGDDGWTGYNLLSEDKLDHKWFGTPDSPSDSEKIFGDMVKSFSINYNIDQFTGVKATASVGKDTIVTGNGNDIVDGQGGDDTYLVNFMGGYYSAYTNILESGNDAADSMVVNGTVDNDDVLIRASDVGLGMIALLPDSADETRNPDKKRLERINYWNLGGLKRGVERISINTGAGDDRVTLDSSISSVSVDMGAGDDIVNVGQVFDTTRKSNDVNKINEVDSFKGSTILTTQGYVSAGAKYASSFIGGDGDDVFNVLHTDAAISLSGNAGDDRFNIGSFIGINSDSTTYQVKNGPVTVIGGVGDDSMSINGTEGDDTFVFTEGTVISPNVDVQAVGVENQDVCGGDGDDSFYVLDTPKGSVYSIKGNNGNDSFYNGGAMFADGVEKSIDISGGREEDASASENIDVVLCDKDGNVLNSPEGEMKEGDGSFKYSIKLSRALVESESVSITVFVPVVSSENTTRGDRGIFFLDKGEYKTSLTLTFDKDHAMYTIEVVAFADSLREGNDYFAILHNVPKDVSADNPLKVNPCRNMMVFLHDSMDSKEVYSALTTNKEYIIRGTEDHQFFVGLDSLPNQKDISVWAEGLDIDFDSEINGNLLTVSWDNNINIPAGTRIFINYSSSYLLVDNQSVVQMKYSADSIVGKRSIALYTEYYQLKGDSNDSFLTYSSTDNKHVTVNYVDLTETSDILNQEGYMYCYLKQSVSMGDTIFTVPYGVLGAPVIEYYDAAGNLKRELVAGNDYSLSADGKTVTLKDENGFAANGYVVYRSAIYFKKSGANRTFVDLDLDNSVELFNDEKHPVELQFHDTKEVSDGKEAAKISGTEYYYKKTGNQIVVYNTETDKPISVSGALDIGLAKVNILDDEKTENPLAKYKDKVPVETNSIEGILGAVLEDGEGEFNDFATSPIMLRYGKTDSRNEMDLPDTKDEISQKELKLIRDVKAEREANFDEKKSVDRVFMHNMDSSLEATSTLDALAPHKVAETENPTKDEKKLITAETALLNSDPFSLQFRHKTNGSDINKNISFGNMEYGEVNLGSAKDTATISKTIYRDDNFQTFTVVNSGKGGDTVIVDSYKNGADDQLVINAGEGNDTVTAKGENVTKEGMIVFGGLGNDTIEVDSNSSLVFGDRGQVLYHDEQDNVVTRLGDDKTGSLNVDQDDEGWNAGGSDYATGKEKGDEAYYQTDGNRYGASIARTVTEDQGGNDTIILANGSNVVFGGMNGKDTVDDITTGTGNDLVFGDNGYATFGGHHSVASGLGMEYKPTVDAQATLSFNFQGASQTGLNSGDEVGAADFKANNWNNISGSIAGTYGNDDAELVRFDNGTRASAVSVSYGGIESHRVTSTDRRINLQSYTLGLHGTSSNKDAKMMNSGLMTTAPNDQCDNQLEVAVDGLAQYFESYQVAVYLDLPDANSWETQSVRKVTLTAGAYSQSFYVNDYAGKNFNGSFVQSHYSSLAMLEADLLYNADLEARIARGELSRADAVFKDTSSNYVVFDVPPEYATDRIVVTIEDGIKETNRNGKDIPGIAGIQVKGTFHKQDVAASTDIDHGGRDDIKTGGGEDIVVGGTGNDSITTFGDELYGLYDSDVVFGDNAKLTFMDRDNNINTATTLTTAESVAITNQKASYDDTIDTGDGNDTVVGGIGHDTINAGATDAAEEVLDDVKVLSINFTREDADESAKIRQATYKIYVPIDDQHQGTVGEDYVLDGAGRKIAIDEHGKKIIETVGETAGVVADNDWHNMYVKNGELHDMEDYSSHYVDGVSVKISTYHKNDHGTWNEYNAGNAAITHENSDELDGDTANSKLYNGYIASQQQYEIKLTLDHIDQFREKNGLAKKAKCDLYVYLGGDNNDTDTYNYLYRISLNNDEVHYLNDWTGHKFDGDYKDATHHPLRTLAYGYGVIGDSGVRVELVGNYIVFRDFTGDRASIRILNEYTGGGQSPKNLPVISAVQIVAGEGRANAAIGGDHDKDLVYGDDAKLTFDLDIPFAEDEVLTEYQNRVTEAKSIAIDQAAVTKISTEDTITTGKDRDVVVGGEGKDTITMGDGDDVAVGGSANLIVEHNNPLGVFTPNTEIALDQHTINLNLHQNYLDNDNANQQSFQTRLEQGYIAGVQEVDNTNDRKNEISLGKGRNLHLDGSTNQSALVVEEQQQSTDPGTDPGTTPGTDPGTTPGNDQPGNDQPGNDQPGTQQGDTLPTALEHDGNSVTLSFNQPSMVNVHAGQTIRLVAYNWDGINSWHPNLVMRANPSNGPFPVMTFSWQGGGEPQQFPSKPGEEWFFEVNIPDAYNEVDEQGRKCLAVYVTATADTTFMLTLGSSGN